MLRPSYASQLLTQLRRRTDMHIDSNSAQEKLAMEIADLRTAEAARRQGLECELATERSAKALLQDQVRRTYVLVWSQTLNGGSLTYPPGLTIARRRAEGACSGRWCHAGAVERQGFSSRSGK